jgi:AcrR family transcriptional regulator
MQRQATVLAKRSRWTRRKQARPSEILDAAVAAFAEKGFAATRMDDIARRAGVTKGTIYLYFESKEEVFKSLIRDSIGKTIATTSADARGFEGPTPDLIRLVLRAIANLLATSDRIVLPKIIIAEAGNFPELARFYRTEIIERGLGLLSSIVERGIARKEFRPLPPGHVARLCIAPILFIMIWRTSFAQFDSVPYDFDGLVETHIDILLKGLCADSVAASRHGGGHS